jgi:hypothetical protein
MKAALVFVSIAALIVVTACSKPVAECTKPGDLTAIARDMKIATNHGAGSLSFPQIVEVLKKHGLEVK